MFFAGHKPRRSGSIRGAVNERTPRAQQPTLSYTKLKVVSRGLVPVPLLVVLCVIDGFFVVFIYLVKTIVFLFLLWEAFRVDLLHAMASSYVQYLKSSLVFVAIRRRSLLQLKLRCRT